MSYPPPPAPEGRAIPPRWRWPERLVVGAAGLVLLGMLGTAVWLKPSPLGLGTHQQLGLPPCTLVSWMGIRCPSCGMTTSWAHAVRGHVVQAVRANAGGALLAWMAMVTGPWLLGSALRGQWLGGPPTEMKLLVAGFTILGVTIADWTVRLSQGW